MLTSFTLNSCRKAMRIKTVPRQRIDRTNINNINDTQDAIDLSHANKNDKDERKTQGRLVHDSVDSSIATTQKLKSSSHGNLTNDTSSSECSSEDDKVTTSINDNNNNVKAIDLSTRDCQRNNDDGNSCTTSSEPEDKFKDTFLYKIMTDPTFLESIQQKSKNTRKFECPFCKKEFLNNEELEQHMDIKMDESNQAVCCACKKIFSQKRYLRYHQRCHSERTKFTCDVCTKKYTRLDNLSRHNAFHVNPGKFSCTGCEKTFTRKDLLNKHQKCHENKYRFFCVECVRYFKGQITLNNHRKLFHTKTVESKSE